MRFNPNSVLRKLGFEIRRLPSAPQIQPNLNEEEVAAIEKKLQEFADSRRPDSACASYADLRSYLSDRRIAFFQDVVALCRNHGVRFDERRVADIGCGTGYLLRAVNDEAPAAKLWGFDTFEEMLELARYLCPTAVFEPQSLFKVDRKFDVVFCTETLEHMEQAADALKALVDLLTADGTLVLTVPNGRKDQQESGPRREDGTSYWGHIHFWSPESWQLFLARELGSDYRIDCGQCASGENYAFIHAPDDD